MCSMQCLNKEEYRVAQRVDRYFKSNDMSFQDKLFHAMLIAQYDLEGHHYANDEERVRIARFKNIVDRLLHKINLNGVSSIATAAENGIGEE
ncbi:MAG: hypothetical protein ACM3PE_02585 [Deltaproteobacteria bacterium]